MSAEQREAEIQAKGLTAPRITQLDLEEAIKETDYYVFPKTQLTVCCITLKNGFTVTGESACVSPENFDKILGERIAYENAKRKMWTLLGYALRDRLHAAAGNTAS